LTCYLRQDLLAKAGLKPPESWSAYKSLVDTIAKWAPGLVAVEPWGDDFRGTMFLARAMPYVKHPASHSVFFDIDTGEPLIDSPGFVRALADSRAALAGLAPESLRLSAQDCRRLVLEGRAAMAIACEPGRGDEKAVTRGPGIDLAFVPLPGAAEYYSRRDRNWQRPSDKPVNRVTLCPFSGLSLGVAAGLAPPRSQAAWNLVTFLGFERYDAAFAGIAKTVTRESQLIPPPTWIGPDLRPDELFSYLSATAESLRPTALVPELAVIGRQHFREALTAGIGPALDGRATPEAALQQVGERWRAIAKELGPERVRDSYRKGLGLLPAMPLPQAIPTK
jgi:multiple sugar transport system substrate-binding protein